MSTSTKSTCKNTDCNKPFSIIAQEAAFYENKNLPMPDHCPSCRHKRRMALRSERQMHHRTCHKCSESMLSTYPENAPYTVYCQTCFWENIE